MSDTYEMAVTINPLVCPLLHARLGQCATARERAAVLRALAEKVLRLELTGELLPESTRAGGPASHAAGREPSFESDVGGDALPIREVREAQPRASRRCAWEARSMSTRWLATRSAASWRDTSTDPRLTLGAVCEDKSMRWGYDQRSFASARPHKRRTQMEYQLVNAILHGQRLTEPLTWLFIAACVAAVVAGWKVGCLLDAYQQRGTE